MPRIQPGEKLFISSTTLAEPLVREVYREALSKGAHVEIDLAFRGQSRIFYEQANGMQLEYIPTLKSAAMNNFDAYLAIRAPFNLKEDQSIDPKKEELDLKHSKEFLKLTLIGLQIKNSKEVCVNTLLKQVHKKQICR